MIQGKVIKFGKNVDTDQIIGAHHLTLPTIPAMAGYAFENHDNFINNFDRGDIIVGKENFGCGSSREQAPAVLKHRGVAAVVATGFARIFYRNAINMGLRLIVCPDAGEIKELDILRIEKDHLVNLTTKQQYRIDPLPPFISQILDHGGIVAYLQGKRSFSESICS